MTRAGQAPSGGNGRGVCQPAAPDATRAAAPDRTRLQFPQSAVSVDGEVALLALSVIDLIVSEAELVAQLDAAYLNEARRRAALTAHLSSDFDGEAVFRLLALGHAGGLVTRGIERLAQAVNATAHVQLSRLANVRRATAGATAAPSGGAD